MSPKNFRDELSDHILNLHWKQWTAFGVSSHFDRTSDYILDLEALTVSTLAIGLLDKRLLEVTLEWTQVHRPWLNLNRIKRIGKFFASSDISQQKPLLDHYVLKSFMEFLKKPGSSSPEWGDEGGHRNSSQYEYIELLNNFMKRGTVVEPYIKSPCMLQLFLRNIFGVDARAEMFLYFLSGRRGNSNSISREIFFEQKNLYRILNSWTDAGIIEQAPEAGNPDYGLKDRDQWMRTFQMKRVLIYVNWPRIYQFLDRMVLHLADAATQDDIYLASSFFRDLYSDARYAAGIAKVDLPSEKSFPGKAYYQPFAESVLQVTKKLGR